MSPDQLSPKRIRILCLDGGGVRGLSSLLILKQVVEQFELEEELPHGQLRPRDCFELVVGSGTGGISALFLGRIGLKMDEVIDEYLRMAEVAFQPKRRSVLSYLKDYLWRESISFDDVTLQTYLEQRVQHFLDNKHAPMADSSINAPCRTAVLASTSANIAVPPYVFRSYSTRQERASEFSIVDVGRATCASTGVFPPASLGRPSIPFIDAGNAGFNNPTEAAIDEAMRIWPGRDIDVIVSIGTGTQPIISLDRRWEKVKEMCSRITENCDIVHERVLARYSGQSLYHRLNVVNGLQSTDVKEWEEAGPKGQLAGVTFAYLRTRGAKEKLARCVQALSGRSSIQSTNIEVQNPRFVGTVCDEVTSVAETIEYPKINPERLECISILRHGTTGIVQTGRLDGKKVIIKKLPKNFKLELFLTEIRAQQELSCHPFLPKFLGASPAKSSPLVMVFGNAKPVVESLRDLFQTNLYGSMIVGMRMIGGIASAALHMREYGIPISFLQISESDIYINDHGNVVLGSFHYYAHEQSLRNEPAEALDQEQDLVLHNTLCSKIFRLASREPLTPQTLFSSSQRFLLKTWELFGRAGRNDSTRPRSSPAGTGTQTQIVTRHALWNENNDTTFNLEQISQTFMLALRRFPVSRGPRFDQAILQSILDMPADGNRTLRPSYDISFSVNVQDISLIDFSTTASVSIPPEATRTDGIAGTHDESPSTRHRMTPHGPSSASEARQTGDMMETPSSLNDLTAALADDDDDLSVALADIVDPSAEPADADNLPGTQTIRPFSSSFPTATPGSSSLPIHDPVVAVNQWRWQVEEQNMRRNRRHRPGVTWDVDSE